MKDNNGFYRVLVLFQVYSGATASFAVPPLLLGLLGNVLCETAGWNRGWMALLIFAGLVIGGYSAVNMLKKSESITTMRSQQECDGLYRIKKDQKSNTKQHREDHSHEN